MPQDHTRKLETVGQKFTRIAAIDKPGRFSKAPHQYDITNADGEIVAAVKFQKGKASKGVNGASLQDVVAIALDRARSLQAGGYASRKLEIAGQKLEEALLILQARKNS